jgi:hypothetical protein
MFAPSRRSLATPATIVVMSLIGLVRPAAAGDITFGVKAGVNIASIDASGAGAFETTGDPRAAADVFLGVAIGKGFSFQPELLLTTARFSAADPDLPLSVSSRLIAVPLLLHFKAPGDRRLRVVLFAGPQLSRLSGVTQTFAGVETSIDDEVKDLDVGATFGGGVEVAAGSGAWVFDVRVTLGLTNVNEAGEPAFRSRAFLAMAGYGF